MRLKDGGLRGILQKQFPGWQWSTIEVGATAGGIPDNEFCMPCGRQGWIELKWTDRYYVQIKDLQVSWLMRRWRYNRGSWIAVRRTPHTKQEAGVDQLYLMTGGEAERLFDHGLTGVTAWRWDGGPSNWNFAEFESIIKL